ncbi:MAG: AraC family transcriptional regulator [Spirochaetaceae bacterium]|jgi:AraC-like DNA-binding protein|nr:AraC family transcriptional regulator [Spirochaetaceae bacterium]
MDTIVDMLFFPQLFKCGFAEKANYSKDDTMDFLLRQSYGEGRCLLKPAGKGIVVCVTDYSYRRSTEVVWKQPEYFHLSLWRGSINGILEHIGKKDAVFRQYFPAGFHHCAMGLSFLPDFFDAFMGLRHGISRDELEKAIGALSRFPPPPETAIVLKQIGDAARRGGAGNAWFEAKTLELISLVLDWHRQLETKAPPRLTEYDRAGIAEALAFVEQHFNEPISLGTLAKEAAMSISKFTAAFKRYTGLSTAAYISRFRMERAANMLKNTSVPIGEIAAMVGYKHHASFSAAFQEQFDVVPGAFRKRVGLKTCNPNFA